MWYYCVSNCCAEIANTLCTGRSARFFQNQKMLRDLIENNAEQRVNLDSSQSSPNEMDSKLGDFKALFTLWNTYYSTATVTTTITNTATTVPLSARCVPPVGTLSPLC